LSSFNEKFLIIEKLFYSWSKEVVDKKVHDNYSE